MMEPTVNLLTMLALICFVTAGTVVAQSARDDKIKAAVRLVLDQQVADWNRGDIDAFMDGYHRSDTTVFISGDKVTHGWKTVLENYKRGYDSRSKMGVLAFTELELSVLHSDTAIAVGHWELKREADSPHGRFTLIFRKTKDGWRIVHDHTSAANP
jgi:ketosteroid isomerase-like protein